MKKIMFNDRYGLTETVLSGRKTQTRRILKGKPLLPTDDIEEAAVVGDIAQIIANSGESLITCKLPYKVGEIVAVAQSYCDAGLNPFPFCEAGWHNKMFVRADLMPHQICITNVRIERLQDISNEDCIAEGVVISPKKVKGSIDMYFPSQSDKSAADKIGWGIVYHAPREAYASLIDNVSGKGTWKSNPWVFVYDFELVK